MANSGQYRTDMSKDKNSFSESASGQERRLVRQLIRNAKSITKLDREILIWLTDRWFYHRGGKGVIHPGVEKISRAVERCARTVRYTLSRLREWGFIVPVQYEKGGRNATRYMVDINRILTVFGGIPETVEGDLVAVTATTKTENKPCNFCSRYSNGRDLPRPVKRARWFIDRLPDGLVAGLSRWISPERWLARQETRKTRMFSHPLVGEVPF